jgi:hypothetical protein
MAFPKPWVLVQELARKPRRANQSPFAEIWDDYQHIPSQTRWARRQVIEAWESEDWETEKWSAVKDEGETDDWKGDRDREREREREREIEREHREC